MTERIKTYRERILSTTPTICIERARYYTEAYKNHQAKPVILKRAHALKNTLEKMQIRIEPEELIAGNHSSAIYGAPIFPEYAVEWIIREIDEFEKRPGDDYHPDDKTKKELLEICSYWQGKTTLDKGRALMKEELLAIHEAGIIRAEGNLTSGDAHIAIHFPKVLDKGVNWYIQYVKNLKDKCEPVTEEGIRKGHYYEATLLALEGLQNFILRFAELADILVHSAASEERKAELKRMAANCRHIACNPPEDFYQALQMTWFLQLVLQIESNGHSLSLGRMDQYLYPYYKKDIARGTLGEEQAMELLENMWLKLVSIKKIRSWSHTRFSAGGPLYQNVTIGGQLKDGSDGVNELSFLILRSVGETRLTQPNLSVRFHPELNPDFLKECIEVIRMGFGMPAFNNDSIVIPAFREWGVEEEDAWNYSAIGCIEVAVPGFWGYRCTGKHFLNFMRVFMATLHDGTDPVSGRQFFKGNGKLTEMNDFSQLQDAWDAQVRSYAKAGIAIDTAIDIVLRDEAPDILCSAFTEPCLERGKTIHEGGSKYDFESGLQVGIANLGDSLAAIKKLVFEDKRISAEELMQALESDFEGSKGEKIRQILLHHAPKFGNDEDYTDQLLVKAYGSYIDEIRNFRTIREGCGPIGCRYYAGTSSISGNVPAGSVVPATPDGRKAGKPLAEGSSPSSGADVNGPTAVMKSISKLPATQILGGVLLNQKLTPAMLDSKGNREKLASLLHVFFDDLKGWHVQFNVVDRETLLAAQKSPGEYRDLIVRVAGYSAFFTNLSPDTQNDIIARTQQSL